MRQDPERQILDGSRRAGKTYSFSRQEEGRPAQWWLQEDPEGLVLFVVFYTQACRWSRCLGCNLPSKSALAAVPFRAIAAQIDHLIALSEVRSRAADIHKLLASNNGSVLDQATFPSTALMYLLARLNLDMPAMTTLTLETRVEYVEWDELEFLARALGERDVPADLELAIGFEAFDDRVRNRVFLKGLPLPAFERLVQMMARKGYRLRCYFMQKPVPGISDEEAVRDIERAIDYLDSLVARHGVRLTIHVNPTFVAAGTPLAEAFRRGEYSPPRLRDVARAALHARGKRLRVFLGLFDEGLAVPGGSFVRSEDEALVQALERFNRTQDYTLL